MRKPRGLRVSRQATKILEALEPTPTLQHERYRGVMQLLFAIASHYPNAFPGQRTLSRECQGVSLSTIKRWVSWAVDEGWLIVIPDGGIASKWGTSKSNRYIIPMLEGHEDKMSPRHGLTVVPRRGLMMDPQVRSTTYSLHTKNPSGENTSCSPPTEGLASGQTTVGPMDKSRAEQIAAAAGDRRIEKVPRAKEFNPSRRLANYFLDEWEGLCQEVPRLREFRPADSVGQMVGYFRSMFLAPPAGRVYSPDEVRGYIDRFIDAVHRSTVQIKPNQSAFSRFIGMWGREDKLTYGKVDMDANRRFFEDSQKES